MKYLHGFARGFCPGVRSVAATFLVVAAALYLQESAFAKNPDYSLPDIVADSDLVVSIEIEQVNRFGSSASENVAFKVIVGKVSRCVSLNTPTDSACLPGSSIAFASHDASIESAQFSVRSTYLVFLSYDKGLLTDVGGPLWVLPIDGDRLRCSFNELCKKSVESAFSLIEQR